MTYEDIVCINAWRAFFRDASENSYSIYIHSKHGIQQSDLSGSNILPTQPTQWGHFSLVEVQQALFCKAYEDPENYKFVLLSGDSIPLYSFATIYARLTSDAMGYMTITKGMYQSERERFVNKKAWSPRESWVWYGASQWCILHRSHVELLKEHWTMIVATFNSKIGYAPDEHVYPILFNAFGPFHPGAMFVDWSPSINCSIGHRLSPKTYHDEDLVEEPLHAIYESGALFLRKVCVLTKLNYDWTQAHPLQPSPPRKKTTFVIKSRAKAGAR